MYKLKHIPTGLYYQPHKHSGSNLSKRGKIYQTNTHGLSNCFKNNRTSFDVYCEEGSVVHRITTNLIAWEKCRCKYRQLLGKTLVKDWIVEPVNTNVIRA